MIFVKVFSDFFVKMLINQVSDLKDLDIYVIINIGKILKGT